MLRVCQVRKHIEGYSVISDYVSKYCVLDKYSIPDIINLSTRRCKSISDNKTELDITHNLTAESEAYDGIHIYEG